MRKLLVALMPVFVLTCLMMTWSFGQDFGAERDQLKARQKTERKALKLKNRYAHESLHSREIPKSQRRMMKHQMQREKRELRERQKDERQDMKDRQKALKESRNQF